MKGIKDAQRIVVKVGTSTLTYDTGKVNLRRMDKLAQVQGQRMAVGQAGERIQIDQIVNMALCQHALGQVALEFHVVDDLALWRANGHDQ